MPRNQYLPSAALELAALASCIRAGLVTDAALRESRLFSPVSIICIPVAQGYIETCRPIVLDLARAMRERRFTSSELVERYAENYVEALVSGKLSAEAIRAFIEHNARPPAT